VDDTDRTSGTPDEALSRLEDVLLAYPFDRALPDLATILDDAGIGEDLLRQDDRATKLLHEAIVARPLSSIDVVAQLRTEVELLTLEVQVLTDRLADPRTSASELGRASSRLATIRRRLAELRSRL
jgi:hypothetical protein